MELSEVYINPTVIAMSKKNPEQLVDMYNHVAYSVRHLDLEPREASIVKGLIMYYVLATHDLIMPKKAKARWDKANLSGRVFQDAFERLFDVWTSGRHDLSLANVDTMIKGLDYVVFSQNPFRYRAGIQCKFAVSGTGDRRKNHYLKLKENLDEARKEAGIIPLAAVIFRTENNVPEQLQTIIGADHTTVFLKSSGLTGIEARIQEIRALADWIRQL